MVVVILALNQAGMVEHGDGCCDVLAPGNPHQPCAGE